MTSLSAESRPFSRTLFNVLLAACAVLFLLVRLPWREHLLMWDEAMNLCSVRAFVGGGHDPYSEWFWRYPPVFHLMMVALQPLAEGYVSRVTWLPIALGLATLVTLGFLNRKLFGERMALLSCLALAVMPGAVFYGVWIKQDAAATLFGLLAVLACLYARPWLGGLALGLAILSKQTAAFFAIAIAILLLLDRRWRDLLVVSTVSAASSLWWYFTFAPRSGKITADVLAGAEECWIHPWHYYLQMFVHDLGWFGLAAAGFGVVATLRTSGMGRWALAVVLPSLLVLSAANCKTPWYTMMLYPAIATLQAAGIAGAARGLVRRWPDPQRMRAVGVAAVAVLFAVPMLGSSYEDMMVRREPLMWEASNSSREAAQALNSCVKLGQSALITTMHYYGANIRAPCPIFVIYLKDMPVLVRTFDITLDQLIADVNANHLDWAMVSIPAGTKREQFVRELTSRGCRPRVLRDVLIVNCKPLHVIASDLRNP